MLLTLLAVPGPEETPETLSREAFAAYQAKDYPRFLALERRALALDPSNPRFVYDVACGEALTGDGAAAVRHLETLLARKLDLGAEGDADFTAIRGTPEWKHYVEQLAVLRQPLIRSTTALEVPDRSLVPAGIAVDPATGDTYIGSTRRRKIVRCGRDGRVTDFVGEGQDGLLAVASLLLDSGRRTLFASTATAPHMVGFQEKAPWGAGVMAFDLKTGRLLRKAFLAPDGRHHFLNALAQDGAGNLFVSDSAEPGIYRLAPGASVLESVLPDHLFDSTQGLAFAEDDGVLYVADWTDGLWALDIRSRTRRRLPGPPDVWLGGLDGLTRVSAGFVSVQIGVRPARVVLLRLDAARKSVASVDLLEMARPDYSGPVQGVMDGGDFLYIANSHLDLIDPKSGAFAEEKARPVTILRLPVPTGLAH
jgi:sugar lactone lactonase YvrE